MTFSRILFSFSIFFVTGIFLSSFLNWLGILIPVIFILGTTLTIVPFLNENQEKKDLKTRISLVGIFLIVLSSGFIWHSLNENRKNNSELMAYSDSKQELILKGIVVEEPELRDKTAHLIVEVIKIKDDSRNESIIKLKNKEKVLIVTEKYLEIDYNDAIEIKGKINQPQFFNGFDYPGYLAKEKIYSIIFYPEIKIVNVDGSFLSIKKEIIEFRKKARENIHQDFPSPHSSILAAMILGDKRKISEEWQEKLSVTGIRHITAVSGLHVTIIIVVLIGFFSGIGLNKKLSVYMTAPLILFFIIMTGMQASAIRSGIMGGCVFSSQIFGRMNNSFRMLVSAAFLMLVFNPLLLKHDIGFQLSFLAVFGIIVFESFFKKVFRFLPKIVREITAVSFSANIFVFPLIGYHFGKVSLIFPLTNLLILPIVYWILFLGMIFIIFSFVSIFLSAVFLIPLHFLLIYLVGVVHFFSQIPWASIVFKGFNFFFIITYLLFVFWLNNKRKIIKLNELESEIELYNES